MALLPIRPFRLFMSAVKLLARNVSAEWIETVTMTAVNAKAESLGPADGLRLLFRLDAKFYESQSRLAKELGQGQHPKHRLTRYHDFFVERVVRGEKVLDVGCGLGQLAFALADRAGAQVTGIDLNAENIALARQNHQHHNLVFRQGDVLADIPSGAFDTVVLSNVLEHLPDRPAFLRNLMAVTQAKRLLLRVPSCERDWRLPLKRELGVEWRADPTHETEHTYDELVDELEAAGLHLLEGRVRWGEILAVAVVKP